MCNFDQETYDALFEAGYSIEEINGANTNKSLNDEDMSDSEDSDDSEELPEDSLEENEISNDENINGNEILKKVRIKNVNRIMIGSLNINSLPKKFDQLKEIIAKNLDILTIQETKLDASFPPQQFVLPGYSEPYRLDRNRDGGGVLVYVREDIPSKLLNKHNFTKYVEGLFVEINLRKTKLLFFGGYRSDHREYGLSKMEYLEQLCFGLDKYSGYEKVLIAGDFNIDNDDEILQDFLFEQNLKNLIKEPTCY